jgi:hypothetical protein
MQQVSTHRVIQEVRRIISADARRRTRVARNMMDQRTASENLERDLQQLKELMCPSAKTITS